MLKQKESQRGSALMLVTIISLILAGISAAYITMSWWNQRRVAQDEAAVQAMYIVEAGAAQYLASLNQQGGTVTPTPQVQTSIAGGSYWVPVENIVTFSDANVVGAANAAANLNDDYWSFQVAGKYNGVVRRVNVLVSHQASSPWDYGYFAGNQVWDGTKWVPGDPAYMAYFGGNATLGTTDRIEGKVYSGGNIDVELGAQILNNKGDAPGTAEYAGTNKSSSTDPTFKSNTQAPLEIKRDSSGLLEAQVNAADLKAKGLTRDTNGTSWVDVGAEYSKDGIPNHLWSNDGSYATDLPAKNPAHFLRQNPTSTNGKTNRTATYERSVDTTTVKTKAGVSRNDYYVEDTYQKDGSPNNDVRDASLSGHAVNGDTTASMLNIQPDSNNAVYFIEGNMRVSGETPKSYQLNPTDGAPIKMTFIVKGNVSLTDNLLYPQWESSTDVVAIVAVKDDVNWPNTIAADFTSSSGGVPGNHPNGPTVKEFVDAYNTRAANSGGNMDPLSLPSDAARASQEYNKIYGSGNVFFGDPGSGTVEHFEAFMYAENNFYATNLDATKSSGGTDKVEIYGNMTAGNQVLLDRATRSGSYIPLHINHNDSMTQGRRPPGVPNPAGKAGIDWNVKSWKVSTTTAELDNAWEK